MNPLALSGLRALVRGGGFLGFATLGTGEFFPSSARLGVGLLLGLLAWCGAPPPGPELVQAPLLPLLAGELLVAGLLGFTFSLPFRAALAGAEQAGGRLVRGGGGIPRAAVFLGVSAWVAAGGLEALLRVFLAGGELGVGEILSALGEIGPVAALGKAFFASLAGALLPSLGFLLGLRFFLALTRFHAGRRPAWLPGLVTLAGVLFLGASLDSFARVGQESLGAGVQVVGGEERS